MMMLSFQLPKPNLSVCNCRRNWGISYVPSNVISLSTFCAYHCQGSLVLASPLAHNTVLDCLNVKM